MRISDWSSDVCSSDLDEDVDGALRGVIAVEDVRYPVVEHPRGAGRVGDHLVQRLRIDAGADTEGHRLGRGGDVHAAEELVYGLQRPADAVPVSGPVALGAARVPHARVGAVGRA